MSLLLSICIPTYNRADFLKRTLYYLLEQIDFEITEIIISDNASSDNTEEVIKEYTEHYPCIKYNRNEKNIGLDDNAIKCIKLASGEYVWFCSDDDLPLFGTFKEIQSAISSYSPKFIFLNFGCFLDNEKPDNFYKHPYKPAYDKKNIVYYDGEKMLRDLEPTHFSALIFKRELALKYIPVVEDYGKQNFQETRIVYALTHHLILTNKGPFIFIGRLCLAVRYILAHQCRYKILNAYIIDFARHYQILRKKGLINKRTESLLVNRNIKKLPKIILSLKCREDFNFDTELIKSIIKTYKRYPLFFIFIYPFFLLPILVLPRKALIVPYRIGYKIYHNFLRTDY
ncbi:MAG: glycosyltransferase [Candidatus Omnitrophica bacterium]|jgi:glycosyltransferase involved in cell wall biosynthesis|nr:glycosyltransferase [Candidatus Omnitrophota bacterium]